MPRKQLIENIRTMDGKFSLKTRSPRKMATFSDSNAETESPLPCGPLRPREERTNDQPLAVPPSQPAASQPVTRAEGKDISDEIASPQSTRMEDPFAHLRLHAKERTTLRREASQIKR